MAGVFCLHGMSVFDLEVIIPRVNVLDTGQPLEERMLLPDSGFFSSPVYSSDSPTLPFTKDDSARHHDPGMARLQSQSHLQKVIVEKVGEWGALPFTCLHKVECADCHL